MAGNSKKQGGKKKTTKKSSTVAKSTVNKASNKTTDKTTSKAKTSAAPKKTKKPASFSKNAAAKNTPKKSTKKVEKKVTEPAKKSNFDEFETLKLAETTKLDSKIIIRDVEREAPITAVLAVPEEPKPLESKPENPKLSEQEPKTLEKPVHDIIISKPVVKVTPKPTAQEIKEQEIQKAIKNATKLPAVSTESRRKRGLFVGFGWQRALLAATCIVTAIFAIVYFVNITSADMSLRTAAAQSGIDAAYPSYTPRGYTLSDVTSSSGKVSMHFKSTEGEFGITEEISNWDSEALLNNYIKPTYGNSYTVIREQGLTLFMGDNWEAWINGGVLYRLVVDEGSLTKKQMNSIATSF